MTSPQNQPPSDPWGLPPTHDSGGFAVPDPHGYPTSGAGHPTSGPGYPASGPSYPTSGPGYPTSGPGYPTSGQGYPASGSGHPTSGAGYPVPTSGFPGQAGEGPIIVQIGEMGVTSATVHTPAGPIPLKGSNWAVHDYWHNETKIPTWAIVLAVAGFCVLTVFSLLFLLAKETITRGTVQVTVTNGNQQYVCRLQVTHPSQVNSIHQQVNYVRSLAAL